ncbi:MAG: Gfo/Idh/MocA family oxidoreductase [Propionicimonas sp.]|uniref:Gfo/Idh/MocA family protein n=1 Tax=Propionicimonas sp. TaxID=1955623 RepID=UPI002B205E81|nr:Gfo/Idh/MocA family oxidoreductase [Propionicimonas sp.]MEA4943820.1 Gfo/Idh/MocA family oxidoreductase [Propionicimonas sp.]MEA5052081.1 Gfo/Idh/MocA family oxidoreductase [Propionicimonas sp.]
MSGPVGPSGPIRVGLIGVGLMGQVHATNLQRAVKAAELVALADVRKQEAQSLAEALAVERVYRDGLELIADPDVDAIVVASPDISHGPLVLAALEAGKPVLCEKPLAGSVEEAQQILAQESALGRRLVQVGFMRDFDPFHRSARETAESGEIGKIVLFRGQHISPGAGEGSGGPPATAGIIGALIHDIHSVRRMTGLEITSVFLRNRYLPDATAHLLTANFALENGGVAILDVNFEAQFGYAVHVELVGTNGTVETAQPRSRTVFVDGQARQDIAQTFQERFGDAYLAEMQAWIDGIRLQRPCGPSAWDGYAASAVADACIRAVETGRSEPVELASRPPLYGG